MATATPTQLQALAARVSKNAEAITTFCQSAGHPQRSLDQIDVESLLPSDASRDLQQMRQDLIDAAMELQMLGTDVREFWSFQAVQVCGQHWFLKSCPRDERRKQFFLSKGE